MQRSDVYDSKDVKESKEIKKFHSALTQKDIQNKTPQPLYYLNKQYKKLTTYITDAASVIYHSVWSTLSLDQVDFHQFKKIIWPTLSACTTLLASEAIVDSFDFKNENTKSYIKFFTACALLSISAVNRMTEKRPTSTREISLAVATELTALTWFYSSAFRLSRNMTQDIVSDSTSVMLSTALSGIALPGIAAHLARKYQKRYIDKQISLGSQRSDTATLSAGMSLVGSSFFNLNFILFQELSTASRAFQFFLIWDNVANTTVVLKQIRNIPAYVVDIVPSMFERLRTEQGRLNKDYQFNTVKEKVLRFTKQGWEYYNVMRKDLRNGDLVVCEGMDLSSLPVTGRLFVVNTDESKPHYEQGSVSTNLVSHTGEDKWFSHKTPLYREIKPAAVRLKEALTSAAVLTGSKLKFDLKKNNVMAIEISHPAETVHTDGHQKFSIIDDDIRYHKTQMVKWSIIHAFLLALVMRPSFYTFTPYFFRLLFNVFQAEIPFSEAFVRSLVNNHHLNELNESLSGRELKLADAMRIVDFYHAMGNYYPDRFPKGVAIVSDKTGTLTTSAMNVLGLWTTDMVNNVSEIKNYLLPKQSQQYNIFELFAAAYTHSDKEQEPEEYAMLEFFKTIFHSRNCLTVSPLGANQFLKNCSIDNTIKTIQTTHLGLFRSFGGRLTLVEEGKNHYLVYCGVPRAETFYDTALLKHYSTMTPRTGVLARDWCVARTEISAQEYEMLLKLFSNNLTLEIEDYVKKSHLHEKLQHGGTFIINNPVKEKAENFIPNCRKIGIPVFVATGDTARAAENTANVLCRDYTNQVIVIRPNEEYKTDTLQKATTVIFVGLNPQNLMLFDGLMMAQPHLRPIIIFAEMTPTNKGDLVKHLKKQNYFVVANGDEANDIDMMKYAHMVIAHTNEKGSHPHSVAPFVDLSDRQLQALFNTKESFYELFDIQKNDSQFLQLFARLANSQVKPSMLAQVKVFYSMYAQVGIHLLSAEEIAFQHEKFILADLALISIGSYEIIKSSDYPADNKNLRTSNFRSRCMLTALAITLTESLAIYALTDKAANTNYILLSLTFLPLILRSLFNAFGYVQDEKQIEQPRNLKMLEGPSEQKEAKQKFSSKLFGVCRRRKKQDVKLTSLGHKS